MHSDLCCFTHVTINQFSGRIFGLVLFKERVTDQEVWPAGQRQLGAGGGKRLPVLFRIIEQDQELVKNTEKSINII